jgi:hypothetical protein
MATNFAGVKDTNIQTLLDAFVLAIRRNGGAFPAAAPNSFTDSYGKITSTNGADDGTEVKVTLKVNPNGSTMWARVDAGGGTRTIEGALDLNTLLNGLPDIDSP